MPLDPSGPKHLQSRTKRLQRSCDAAAPNRHTPWVGGKSCTSAEAPGLMGVWGKRPTDSPPAQCSKVPSFGPGAPC